MPSSNKRKKSSDDSANSNRKPGRPSNTVHEDTHPELLPGYYKSQPMTYDSAEEAPRNEIEFMLKNLQKSIDEKNNTWAFVIKQLVEVFLVMAYDKVKGSEGDLGNTAQCESMVTEFEGAITTLPVQEDYVNILLIHFPDHQLPDAFHEHVNTLRVMTPVTARTSWDSWLKANHSKCTEYTSQQRQNLYFGPQRNVISGFS